jgi:hypothetical protein
MFRKTLALVNMLSQRSSSLVSIAFFKRSVSVSMIFFHCCPKQFHHASMKKQIQESKNPNFRAETQGRGEKQTDSYVFDVLCAKNRFPEFNYKCNTPPWQGRQ